MPLQIPTLERADSEGLDHCEAHRAGGAAR